ncbi:MFS transporter [Deinococcus marmoris]|uniref:Tetracycline resistance protein n=1 Tax=Deinococcus marmoris TaxID=249408 RepID=A0A1U7NSB4_9DEIO|nr:MFS transporter [Deinococcus marmoris]OLV15806.1 Tetracycline resistance protein [Deinococcus marmoris]
MLKTSDPTRVYLALSAGLAFAFALAYTLQGLYFVTVAGLDPLQLLLIGAALEGAAFLLEVPTGVVADVYSRRRSVILGCLCLGVAMALVAAFPVFWALLLTQIVSAAGYTFLSGAQQAWLADEVGEDRAAHLYLLGSQYGRAAGIAGIAATAALATLGLHVPILAGGAVALILALYLWVRMPEDGFSPAPREERQTWAVLSGTFRQGVREVRASRVLTLLMLSAVLYGASSEALDRLSEFLLVVEVGLPGGLSAANWFVLLALTVQVVGFIVTEPLRRRIDPADARAAALALRWVLGLSVAALLAFAYAPGFGWAALALVVHGVLRGLYSPLYDAWINRGLNPASRATVNSIASQADALGQVTFGPVFGLLGNVLGVRAALALAALVRLPTLEIVRRAGAKKADSISD